ncbi:hypothetical protein MTBUT4_300046 [Magnetospirillum sp. UT-4]|nr:hypothetical protein MTBUT4_300046 [Magnetospirillum sp. UT-4]
MLDPTETLTQYPLIVTYLVHDSAGRRN